MVLVNYLGADFKILFFFWLKRRRRVLEGSWPPQTPFVNPLNKKIRFPRVPPLVFRRVENLPRDNQVPGTERTRTRTRTRTEQDGTERDWWLNLDWRDWRHKKKKNSDNFRRLGNHEIIWSHWFGIWYISCILYNAYCILNIIVLYLYWLYKITFINLICMYYVCNNRYPFPVIEGLYR